MSSPRETHPGSTTQMLQEHATCLFRASSTWMAATMPPLTSGSWSRASTAAVLKGGRQVGVSTDSHPEVLLPFFPDLHLGLPSRSSLAAEEWGTAASGAEMPAQQEKPRGWGCSVHLRQPHSG